MARYWVPLVSALLQNSLASRNIAIASFMMLATSQAPSHLVLIKEHLLMSLSYILLTLSFKFQRKWIKYVKLA